MRDHRRGDAYSVWQAYALIEARDDMLDMTDTDFVPWNVIRADNKRRDRLNCIHHLLSTLPYEEIPFKVPKLPKRATKKKYNDQASLKGRRLVEEKY